MAAVKTRKISGRVQIRGMVEAGGEQHSTSWNKTNPTREDVEKFAADIRAFMLKRLGLEA